MTETPTQSSSRRLNIIAVVLLVIVIGVIIIATKNRPESNLGTPPTSEEVAAIDSAKIIVSYQGKDGKTAYDLLKEQYTVVADETAFGPMVKSINDEASTDSTFWTYKVNNELATVGSHEYTTKSTDTITWELTAIE